MSEDAPERPGWLRLGLFCGAISLVVIFVLLGNWQVRRLSWKLDLIDAVEIRAHGDPVALPAVFDPEAHSYLRVFVQGTPLPEHLLVKAVTELGPGWWVMRPFETGQGLLWINQGFVTADHRVPELWPPLPHQITGLLRPTVPDGTLLERNKPSIDRWVSRDTSAMAAHLGLDPALSYFLDADHIGPLPGWPRGGMTRIDFRNTHLSYALTWYAMAILLGGAVLWLGRGLLRAFRLSPAVDSR